jgi:hypothetical protein
VRRIPFCKGEFFSSDTWYNRQQESLKQKEMIMTQQKKIEGTARQPAMPQLPTWPTSIPGPKITQPPLGTRRMHVRTEQVIEVDYDSEQGKSSTREA